MPSRPAKTKRHNSRRKNTYIHTCGCDRNHTGSFLAHLLFWGLPSNLSPQVGPPTHFPRTFLVLPCPVRCPCLEPNHSGSGCLSSFEGAASEVRGRCFHSNHTGSILFFECDCSEKDSIHRLLKVRFGFSFNELLSSYILNFPNANTFRRNDESIGLVKQSASIIAVEIHLHSVVFSDCCLISITSIVVRHSWQLGVAILFTRSHRLLQSVIRRAFGSFCKESSGFCHWKLPSLMNAHIHLNHVTT